jgi:hydantoinase/carbamoylase family amidase
MQSGSNAMNTEHLRIAPADLLQRLQALGRVGDTGNGGCCRLALTDADRAGRDLVCGWMRELGLRVQIDPVGNIFGWRDGLEDLPPVMTGSHIDTVATGGRYDGNYGVLAGLSVVQALNTAGVTTRHPLVVAVFTNEEGARFQPDMLGSLVYAGGLSRWRGARHASPSTVRCSATNCSASATWARRHCRWHGRTLSSNCTSNKARSWMPKVA